MHKKKSARRKSSPLLTIGKGRILLATSGFDIRTGNLTTRQSFVPLVHELVTWLAGAGGVKLNVEATWRPALALPGGAI